MPVDLTDPRLRARAVEAALGRAPFDLLVGGGQVVDVALGRSRPADLGIVGALVASVHAPGSRADAAMSLDASGAFVAPGLIDAHMHIESSMTTPRAYAQTVLPQGTTTIVWDPHEIANVLGLPGLHWALAAARDLPLEVIALAPSCVPSAPGLEIAGAAFDGPEMREMLSWPEIAGVAEVMDMRGVLAGATRMREIVGAGLAARKLVCGHARGLEGRALQGYAAAGIGSDHEIVSAEDLIAKLEAGIAIELRGSHDYILPACVAALKALPLLPQTLALCTDDVFPDDLVEKGGMVDLLRRLIRYGLPAHDALRAATINSARRLGRDDLGLVAAGRRANLAIFEDLTDFAVRAVVADGAVVAQNGALTAALRPDAVAPPASTMRLAPLRAEDFMLRAPGVRHGRARLNVIEGARFTRWSEALAEIRDGCVVTPHGHALMAAVHRHGRADPTPRLAVIGDWGAFKGAFATTVAHDSHNLMVFGGEPADMAAAANALIDCGGGMAVAAAGRVTAVLPLPICGLVSTAPARQTAAAFRAVQAAADRICEWRPPYRIFRAFVGASLACNAGPHLTDVGLADGGTGEIRPAIIEALAAA